MPSLKSNCDNVPVLGPIESCRTPAWLQKERRLRLKKQVTLQNDWDWRREAQRQGGTVSGSLELEQQLQAISVPRRVHPLSFAQLGGTN